MTEQVRVLHLVGSATSDLLADVSLLYARGCLDAVRGVGPDGAAAAVGTGDEHAVALVSPDGSWRFPGDLSEAALAAAPRERLTDALRRIEDWAPDVALPQMFCVPGTTRYRSQLEQLGVPYPGNRPEVMALAADKAWARAVVAAAGVPVPEGRVVRHGEGCAVSGPVVVKPVDADNSVGVTLVPDARDDATLHDALAEACRHSDRALVERFVPLGREVRCGVVELDGRRVCLPLEEYAVDAASKPVRLEDDKLARDDDGGLRLVAKDASHAWIVDPSDPVTGPVHAAALAAYDALGCRHYGLFDFRVDPAGTPYFLEAGLYCSFAPGSVLVTMAAAAGTGLDQLYRSAVRAAVSEASEAPRPRLVREETG